MKKARCARLGLWKGALGCFLGSSVLHATWPNCVRPKCNEFVPKKSENTSRQLEQKGQNSSISNVTCPLGRAWYLQLNSSAVFTLTPERNIDAAFQACRRCCTFPWQKQLHAFCSGTQRRLRCGGRLAGGLRSEAQTTSTTSVDQSAGTASPAGMISKPSTHAVQIAQIRPAPNQTTHNK